MTNDLTQASEKSEAETPEPTKGGRIYRPLTDIVETDEGVTLMLEMPGVSAEDVDITLEKRVLTIRGTLHAAQPENLAARGYCAEMCRKTSLALKLPFRYLFGL